jgi:multicomponent Na+:H+ antiporter subunit C
VISFAVTAFMLGIIYRTWVLARQDEIQDDVEDRRVAETPRFDAEDDAPIPAETSEFPLTMLGSDGSGISDHAAHADHTESGDSVVAGAKTIPAADAAAEEQPGSRNVTPGPEGGVK